MIIYDIHTSKCIYHICVSYTYVSVMHMYITHICVYCIHIFTYISYLAFSILCIHQNWAKVTAIIIELIHFYPCNIFIYVICIFFYSYTLHILLIFKYKNNDNDSRIMVKFRTQPGLPGPSPFKTSFRNCEG
jgi:hypothetical protein